MPTGDLSPAAVHGRRRDFIEAWTSLDTALSGGFHITEVKFEDAEERMIAVGVDTHKDCHVAVALDRLGELVGEIVIEASTAGYRELEVSAPGENWTICAD